MLQHRPAALNAFINCRGPVLVPVLFLELLFLFAQVRPWYNSQQLQATTQQSSVEGASRE